MTLSNTEKENFIPRSNFLGYTEIEIVQTKIRINKLSKIPKLPIRSMFLGYAPTKMRIARLYARAASSIWN